MASLLADRLAQVLVDLNDNRGELAEVLKAEAQAKSDAYLNSSDPTVKGRERESDALSLPHTLEAIDLRVNIQQLESWERFYTLCIEHDLDPDLGNCYPDKGGHG